MVKKRIDYVRAVPKADFFIIVDIRMSKPIGFFGLNRKEIVALFIEPEYRRKGYTTELFHLLAEREKVETVVTSPENIPLQKCLEKLGYTKWYKYER